MCQTKRLEHIDVVAGIMITWMVLGHCTNFSYYVVPMYYLLSFYMPWFFYKSGAFFCVKNFKELLHKDTIKLIRTFVVYSFIGWVVWSICGLLNDTLIYKDCFIKPLYSFLKMGCISGNGPLWFLISLFLVRQIANFILLSKIPSLVWSFICFVCAFVLYSFEWYDYSWWFGNVFSGLCFFLLGVFFKKREQKWYILLIALIVYFSTFYAFVTGILNDFPYLYMHANKMFYGSFVLFFPMAIAGIIVINNIFRFLCKKVSFRILGYIGRNSMNIYVTHWILFTFVCFIAKSVFHIESPILMFTILVGASILFLPIICLLIDSIKRYRGNL